MKCVALLTAATLLRPGEASPSATMRFMEHLHGSEAGSPIYGKSQKKLLLINTRKMARGQIWSREHPKTRSQKDVTPKQREARGLDLGGVG